MNGMKIGVIGTGYVGLVSGLCFADFGFSVICGDKDKSKVDMLNSGRIPIYEPGLDTVHDRVTKQERISFTTDIAGLVRNCEVIFICVGTPPTDGGAADLRYVWQAAETIGENLDTYKVIVDKSTVPVGTTRKVHSIIGEKLKERHIETDFDVVSNPEFLREGKALYDFTHPDRVVIGSDSERAIMQIKKIYNPLNLNEVPFVITNPETAELIKYSSNAFLATKIAFINEIANLCEAVHADVQKVAKAMGMDGRIGSKFLHPGPGYGGSCFPKDTRALASIAKECGVNMQIVPSVVRANEAQKLRMAGKIRMAFGGDLRNTKIAILGLSFKPETNDVRESPALTIISELAGEGADITVYDPQAMTETRKVLFNEFPEINYAADEYEACAGADGVAILTDWNQFRRLDLCRLKRIMKGNRFFDYRNIYGRRELEDLGFRYDGVGK